MNAWEGKKVLVTKKVDPEKKWERMVWEVRERTKKKCLVRQTQDRWKRSWMAEEKVRSPKVIGTGKKRPPKVDWVVGDVGERTLKRNRKKRLKWEKVKVPQIYRKENNRLFHEKGAQALSQFWLRRVASSHIDDRSTKQKNFGKGADQEMGKGLRWQVKEGEFP